jgi:tRNA nucleotidyltransferase (CCA-adding enzyme)
MKLYAVGGAVRDYLRGSQGKDLDFAVEAESFDAMMDALRERGFEAWQTRPEFVTTKGRIPLANVGRFRDLLPEPPAPNPAADFTLCRKEAMYHDKRHPSEVTPADLMADLSRRDFTFNAIAISEDGQIIDPFHGEADMALGLVRTVGDPHDRFTEDPLRILRALRFAVTLTFSLDAKIINVLLDDQIVNALMDLPVERVREELHRMFKYDWRASMMRLVLQHPLVGQVLYDAFPDLWLKPTTEDR